MALASYFVQVLSVFTCLMLPHDLFHVINLHAIYFKIFCSTSFHYFIVISLQAVGEEKFVAFTFLGSLARDL